MNKRAICNTRDNKRTGFLSRLKRDSRGNTLAIVGAAFIPLTAMIGSGVDIARVYMAESRLQAACDSASLAARRVMTNYTLDNKVTTEANKFFNFNFPQGTYEVQPFTPVVTKPQKGTVHIAVNTRIPTSVMKIFGFGTMPLSVECEASQNFVNTDIVLVLDVTGSMAQDNKIGALRDAVMALYDELKPIQDQLTANGMRLRYGIVPYSSAVNVGRMIYQLDPDYLVDSYTYQSRLAVFQKSTVERVGTSMTNAQCGAYAQPRTPADSYPSTQKTVSRPGSGSLRPCDVTTTTFSTEQDASTTFAHWFHAPRVLDTSAFKTFATIPLPTRHPTTNTTTQWDGCIEERDTVDTINATSGLTPPSSAKDLQIDLIPNKFDETTKWRPLWHQAEYRRSGVATEVYADNQSFNANAACPAEAVPLKTWGNRSDLRNYVDTLSPTGNTYHDIGMIWGARLISPRGIFGASNPETYNAMPVSKHIIFMTDGIIQPSSTTYSSYGVEAMDQRVSGESYPSDLAARHEQRFRMACQAAKGMNVSIWVVAFASAPSPALYQCASSASQVSISSNRDELIAKFTEIGKNIGSLRLSL